MRFNDNITLSYQGLKWIASYKGYKFSSDSLEDLDRRIKFHLEETLAPAEGDIITINYLFDNSSIPEWIRQYSNHYFNRKVEFKY